jgi:hypothetical protein
MEVSGQLYTSELQPWGNLALYPVNRKVFKRVIANELIVPTKFRAFKVLV